MAFTHSTVMQPRLKRTQMNNREHKSLENLKLLSFVLLPLLAGIWRAIEPVDSSGNRFAREN